MITCSVPSFIRAARPSLIGLLGALLLTACTSLRIEDQPTAASTETNKVDRKSVV